MKKNWKLQLLSVFLVMLFALGSICACKEKDKTPSSNTDGGSVSSEIRTGAPTEEQSEDSAKTEQPETPEQPEQPASNPWGISDGDIQTPTSKIYHNGGNQ